MEGKTKKITKKVLLYALLIALAVIWIVPIFTLVATSLKHKKDFISGLSLFQLPEYLLEGSSGPAVQEPVKTRHKTAAPAYSRTSVRFNENALRFYVLSSIYEGTEPAHGMGRSALLQILKAEGIGVSDSKLREVLADLAAEDLIIIGRGRHGTRITEKGTAWLQNNHL